jgi:SAM-dependent methyltransferase
MSMFKKLRKKIIFNFASPKIRFKEIYHENLWESSESVSGPGSTMDNTISIRKILPEILKRYNITSLLDIPCGDFNWMRSIDLQNIKYIGADIVPELIKNNQSSFSNLKFIVANIIEDKLPDVDLIFSRDCLIHLSNKLILKSIENIKRSNATYLLTNSFPDVTQNIDIKTGTWRRINLLIKPFNLPKPLAEYEEKEHLSTVCGRKMLYIWKIENLLKS